MSIGSKGALVSLLLKGTNYCIVLNCAVLC